MVIDSADMGVNWECCAFRDNEDDLEAPKVRRVEDTGVEETRRNY